MVSRVSMRFVLLLVVAVLVRANSVAEGFDKPVSEKVQDLGSSPNQRDYPNLHVHLSCHYFPDFMVKQLTDDGNKGALRISITRLQSRQTPECTRIHRQGEIVISDGWDYYWGVKGGLVVLIGADGLSGGMNFDVFDATNGKKVFRDYVYLPHAEGELNFAQDANGRILLRYERFFAGGCSVPQAGLSCWTKFQSSTGLKDVPIPKCNGYEALEPRYRDDPSVISYQVEVSLFPLPMTKALSKSVKCWAAD